MLLLLLGGRHLWGKEFTPQNLYCMRAAPTDYSRINYEKCNGDRLQYAANEGLCVTNRGWGRLPERIAARAHSSADIRSITALRSQRTVIGPEQSAFYEAACGSGRCNACVFGIPGKNGFGK